MGTTGTYGLPYQELGDPPDGPALGQNLAEAVETELERIDAKDATQDASIGDHESRISALEPVAPFFLGHIADGAAVSGAMQWTAAEDTHAAWDALNKHYTVPVAGLYRIHAAIKWNQAQPAQSPLIQISKNAGVVYFPGTLAAPTPYGMVLVTYVCRCDVGDQLATLLAQANVTVQDDGAADNNVCTIEWLRP